MGAKSIARLAVCALVLPVAMACGIFGGDPSPTPAPELVSTNILTPTPTGESPGYWRPSRRANLRSDAAADIHSRADIHARTVADS